ncbi:glycosyltransferase [Pantoea sp. EA-12]|uniref:glycosyltransferase n=1 Tax=Pantoea sp. EA-12 TaxID=3043303 RepID=UPI0024B5858C|nr:glycosyltransferase [Pantoea sp. EA-12]MDI9219887.1 glycosyltransferase [Pantoea sp. EA-12]
MIYVNITSSVATKRKTGIQRVVVNLGEQLRTDEFCFIAWDYDKNYFKKIVNFESLSEAIYEGKATTEKINFEDMKVGDYFFDVDASWSDGIDRNTLYPKLKEKLIKIINLHYDSVPIVNSSWSHVNTVLRYSDYFYAKIAYSDFIFSISKFVHDEISTLSKKFIGVAKEGSVIPLGPLPNLNVPNGSDTVVRDELRGKRFFLSVGTLEPRKNYDYLIKCFELCNLHDVALVIIGKEGWNVEGLASYLKSEKSKEKNIFWFDDVDDDELAYFYSKCLAYITTSHYEGYGLPAIEALSFGIPSIVSDGGALPEVVGNSAEVFKLDDERQLISIMVNVASDENYVIELTNKAKSLTIPSWNSVGEQVKRSIDDLIHGDKKYNFEDPITQIVYITIDSANLSKSLESVRDKMSFITSVVVLTKSELKSEMEKLVADFGFENTVFCDEDLLEKSEVDISDHQSRNTLLRKRLYAQNKIAQNFIAADDDYLAIRSIESTYFKCKDKHNAYYFTEDLNSWSGAYPEKTSFDKGLIKTARFLSSLGYPARGYSSHMPQVINKKLVNDIYNRFLADERNWGMDEWSIYFNIAYFTYPHKFELKTYEAFGWPGNSSDWVVNKIAEKFTFQNYYPNPQNGCSEVLNSNSEVLQGYREEVTKAHQVELFDKPIVILINKNQASFNSNEFSVLKAQQNMRRILIQCDKLVNTINLELKNDTETITASHTLKDSIWIPFYPPDASGKYILKVLIEVDGNSIVAETKVTIVD